MLVFSSPYPFDTESASRYFDGWFVNKIETSLHRFYHVVVKSFGD